jgi:hypothetical protein
MAYIKPDGNPLTIQDRGALAIAHGLLTADKVMAMSKEKEGKQALTEATKHLVHRLWAQGVFKIDTSVSYVPPPPVRPDPATIAWFESRRVAS